MSNKIVHIYAWKKVYVQKFVLFQREINLENKLAKYR